MSIARMFQNSLFVLIACAGFGLGAVSVASAADADHAAFHGHYQGVGITQNPNTIYFGFDNRDVDVTIGPDGNGFFVEWTTVIRDYQDKETRRNTGRIAFDPTDRPGIYLERAAASRLSDGLAWASIQGQSMTVRVLAILDDGRYRLQSYERSLTDDGMFLFFRSDSDGGAMRFVTARLKKVE